MIIGEKFAWGHLGKTGGDATLTLFRLFPELVVYADGMKSNAKHDSFALRENEIKGKLLILNIRRLPSWLLSYAQHGARYGYYPNYKPLPMLSADEIAQSREADKEINRFTDNGRFKIDRWIRTEYLKKDFLNTLADFTEVSEDKRRMVREIVMVNSMKYDHDFHHWFTKKQIEAMYENNPIWASIEEEVYKSEATDLRHQQQIDHIREVVRTILPPDGTVIVVSKGDDLLKLDVRQAWHFPQNDGVYTRYHLADSAEAIAHLEELRAKGGDFLLFPDTAFWWLRHYGGFRQHLDSRYRRFWSDERCLIYQLCPAEPGSGTADN